MRLGPNPDHTKHKTQEQMNHVPRGSVSEQCSNLVLVRPGKYPNKNEEEQKEKEIKKVYIMRDG